MTEEGGKKPWKSTLENPYKRIYCKDEALDKLIPAENNVTTIEDCALYQVEWHECLKDIEGNNHKDEKIHNCNDFLVKYKFCVNLYKQVCKLTSCILYNIMIGSVFVLK